VLRYVCRKCGYVLLEFDPVKLRKGVNERLRHHGVPEPYYVAEIHKGICPKCGSKLSMPKLEDITISVVE